MHKKSNRTASCCILAIDQFLQKKELIHKTAHNIREQDLFFKNLESLNPDIFIRGAASMFDAIIIVIVIGNCRPRHSFPLLCF